jgi:hypothetical protein
MSFLYRLQKENRFKPLLVGVLLFICINLFSLALMKGHADFVIVIATLVYSIAGYWLFRNGNPLVFQGMLAGALSLCVFAAFKLMTGFIPLSPGIIFTVLFAAMLFLHKVAPTLPSSSRVLFLSLLISGLVSTLMLLSL